MYIQMRLCNYPLTHVVTFLQEAQAAAASSTEAITIGLHQAQASIPQLVKELHSNRQLLQRHLRECQGWADRHQYTVKALRDQIPAELMYPNSHWAADQAPVQLGMEGESTRHDASSHAVSGLTQDAVLSVAFSDFQKNANLNVITEQASVLPNTSNVPEDHQ